MTLPSRPLLAGLLCAASLGCTDTVSPADVAGTYVLQNVVGDPLPAEIYRGGGYITRLIADTLRIGADGLAVLTGSMDDTDLTTGVALGPPQSFSVQLRPNFVGDHIELMFSCGRHGYGAASANVALARRQACVAIPQYWTLVRTDGGLRVTSASGERVPRLYSRISVP